MKYGTPLSSALFQLCISNHAWRSINEFVCECFFLLLQNISRIKALVWSTKAHPVTQPSFGYSSSSVKALCWITCSAISRLQVSDEKPPLILVWILTKRETMFIEFSYRSWENLRWHVKQFLVGNSRIGLNSAHRIPSNERLPYIKDDLCWIQNYMWIHPTILRILTKKKK